MNTLTIGKYVLYSANQLYPVACLLIGLWIGVKLGRKMRP